MKCNLKKYPFDLDDHINKHGHVLKKDPNQLCHIKNDLHLKKKNALTNLLSH